MSHTNKIEKTWGEFFFIVLHHRKAFASALETLRLRGTLKEFKHTTLKDNAAAITIKNCQRIITEIVSSADTFNNRDFGKFLHKLTLEKLVTYLIHHPDDANKTHAFLVYVPPFHPNLGLDFSLVLPCSVHASQF